MLSLVFKTHVCISIKNIHCAFSLDVCPANKFCFIPRFFFILFLYTFFNYVHVGFFLNDKRAIIFWLTSSTSLPTKKINCRELSSLTTLPCIFLIASFSLKWAASQRTRNQTLLSLLNTVNWEQYNVIHKNQTNWYGCKLIF